MSREYESFNTSFNFDEFLNFCIIYPAKCVLTYARDALPEKYLIQSYAVSEFILMGDELEFIQGLVSKYNEQVLKILGGLGDITESVFVEPISNVGFGIVEWQVNDQVKRLPDGMDAAASLFKQNAGEILS